MAVNRSLTNAKSRAQGAWFEKLIDKSCNYYRKEKIADIWKTPEPMKTLQGLGNGKFVAVYTGKAQPDYKGILAGGRGVMFEAKSTSTGKLYFSRVTVAQSTELELAWSMGAEVFVLVDYFGEHIAKIPWEVWRELQKKTRRKYVIPGDVYDHMVEFKGGIIKFLG